MKVTFVVFPGTLQMDGICGCVSVQLQPKALPVMMLCSKHRPKPIAEFKEVDVSPDFLRGLMSD